MRDEVETRTRLVPLKAAVSQAAKAIVQQIPLVGAITAELIRETLPQQEFGRPEKMLSDLSQRLTDLEPDYIKGRLRDPAMLDLMDAGCRGALSSGAAAARRTEASLLCFSYEIDHTAKEV